MITVLSSNKPVDTSINGMSTSTDNHASQTSPFFTLWVPEDSAVYVEGYGYHNVYK